MGDCCPVLGQASDKAAEQGHSHELTWEDRTACKVQLRTWQVGQTASKEVHRPPICVLMLLSLLSCTLAASAARLTKPVSLNDHDDVVRSFLRTIRPQQHFEESDPDLQDAAAEKQCFPFSYDRSIARDDFMYPAFSNASDRRSARRGVRLR